MTHALRAGCNVRTSHETLEAVGNQREIKEYRARGSWLATMPDYESSGWLTAL